MLVKPLRKSGADMIEVDPLIVVLRERIESMGIGVGGGGIERRRRN